MELVWKEIHSFFLFSPGQLAQRVGAATGACFRLDFFLIPFDCFANEGPEEAPARVEAPRESF